MADEILKLGSEQVIVFTPDDTAEVSDAADEGLADALYAAVAEGQPWHRDMFATIPATEFMQALQTFARRYKMEHDTEPFEVDAVVEKAASKLSQTHRLFAAWVMEVRVGLRAVWAAAKYFAAVDFALPVGGIPYTKRVTDMAQSYPLTVLHIGSQVKIRQQNVVFRGYKTSVSADGTCCVGQNAGNVWLKNGWTVPGIRRLNELVDARTRSYVGKKRQQHNNEELTEEELPAAESAELLSHCEKIVTNVKNKRPACVKEENFASAYGRRLDLENVSMMHTFLSLVRSIRAKAVYAHHARLVDCIAEESDYYKSDVIADPSLVGDMEADLRRFLAACDTAATHHHYVGALSLPTYYACFSPTTVPRVLTNTQLTSLDGIAEKCLLLSDMYTRGDKKLLANSPAMLRYAEDFTDIVRQFGHLHVFDKLVTEFNEEYRLGSDSYDTRAEAAEAKAALPSGTIAHIERHVAFMLDGEDEVRELPVKSFHNAAKFKLVPQVLLHQRGGAELDFFRDGTYVGLSASYINARFTACKTRKALQDV